MKRLLIVTIALAACVPAPKKDYTPAEVESVNELDEIMRIHAKHADPLFSIRDQESFSDAEFAQMKEAGDLLRATSDQLVTEFTPKFDAGFGEIAKKLGDHASALSVAAEGRDAAAARTAIAGMREACASCHGTYR